MVLTMSQVLSLASQAHSFALLLLTAAQTRPYNPRNHPSRSYVYHIYINSNSSSCLNFHPTFIQVNPKLPSSINLLYTTRSQTSSIRLFLLPSFNSRPQTLIFRLSTRTKWKRPLCVDFWHATQNLPSFFIRLNSAWTLPSFTILLYSTCALLSSVVLLPTTKTFNFLHTLRVCVHQRHFFCDGGGLFSIQILQSSVFSIQSPWCKNSFYPSF